MQPENTNIPAPSPASEPTAPNTAENLEEYVFTAGYYETGIDIPAGKYDIKWISGRRNCKVTTKDGELVMYEYMSSDDDEDAADPHISEYKNVILEPGTTIEIDGSLKVAFVSK